MQESVISQTKTGNGHLETKRQSSLQAYFDVQTEMKTLESQPEVIAYKSQLNILTKVLQNRPEVFRGIFIQEGMRAIVEEFRKPALSREFTLALWDGLLEESIFGKAIMRFIWDLSVIGKVKLVKALDEYLSDRYPELKGVSKGWPLTSGIPIHERDPQERINDFNLVTNGYLGYVGKGYSLREIQLLVWLEVMRCNQCGDAPCQLGLEAPGKKEKLGGCPVEIHIPNVLKYLGQGKLIEAYQLISDFNPLPAITGRVCPQEKQCQGVCIRSSHPVDVGQIEAYIADRATDYTSKLPQNGIKVVNPWEKADKPPIAIVGSGPAGLINAFMHLQEGFPVAIFEAFHETGGVLRYGIPEFRLPNYLIDRVRSKIVELGGIIITNAIVGKEMTVQQLKNAGFQQVFVGVGAGLPKFMNIPGEHLNGIISANELLTRVNLMNAHHFGYETPIFEFGKKTIMVIGGGNVAMDAARVSKRLGRWAAFRELGVDEETLFRGITKQEMQEKGITEEKIRELEARVVIVYRRDKDSMPVRKEELRHALEEGIELMALRAPREFKGSSNGFVTKAILDVMELGDPDKSGRRSPIPSGKTEELEIDYVIMSLGNDSNPILTETESGIETSKRGTIVVDDAQGTSMKGVYAGGDAVTGGATVISAAGAGKKAAAHMQSLKLDKDTIKHLVRQAHDFLELARAPQRILDRKQLTDKIVEFEVYAPLIAHATQAGQFVRVMADGNGEYIPLTVADMDSERGTITMVIQEVGVSSQLINAKKKGQTFQIAGPLGRPSIVHQYKTGEQVVFVAGGAGLAPVYPILRKHLEKGNHATLIAGFRSADLVFWAGKDERINQLKEKYPEQLDVIFATDDGTYGIKGRVTEPLVDLLKNSPKTVKEVIAIGPGIMMKFVSQATEPFKVPTVVSLNSLMVDATGMCGACSIFFKKDSEGKQARKFVCVEGPEFDAHKVDWEIFLRRLNQYVELEIASRRRHEAWPG